MKEHKLEVKNAYIGYDKRNIIDNISLSLEANKVTIIIGANGSGKSTLLKSLSRLLRPHKGEVLLDNNKLLSYKPKDLAKILGLLPQTQVVPEGIKVIDLIMRARYPYRKFLSGITKDDEEAVKEAIKLMNIETIADRNIDELSGGQRQRVWIAMSLAQQTDILLLDEPTTYLDIAYQVEILETLCKINQEKGITIVMVLHDLNLSARYADNIIAMKKGKVVSQGKVEKILNKNLIKEVFDLNCEIIEDPIYKTPIIVPLGDKVI